MFCLLFRRHDQSDISPICVSSGGEEEEFGEFCLLISSGLVHCALGTLIKNQKIMNNKKSCSKMKQNCRFVFYYWLISNMIGLTVFLPTFLFSGSLKGGLQFECMLNLCSAWVKRKGKKIKGMRMAWPRSAESESNRLFWSYLIFMNNFLDISFAPWSRPLLQCYTMMS